MSDNTVDTQAAGDDVNLEAMNAEIERAKPLILEVLKTGQKVQVENDDTGEIEAETMNMSNFTLFARKNGFEPGPWGLAILELIDANECHSAKGRGGGLKLGPKPLPTHKSEAAMLLAKLRKATGRS